MQQHLMGQKHLKNAHRKALEKIQGMPATPSVPANGYTSFVAPHNISSTSSPTRSNHSTLSVISDSCAGIYYLLILLTHLNLKYVFFFSSSAGWAVQVQHMRRWSHYFWTDTDEATSSGSEALEASAASESSRSSTPVSQPNSNVRCLCCHQEPYALSRH